MFRLRGTLLSDILISGTGDIDVTSAFAALSTDTQVKNQPLYYDAVNDVFKVTAGIYKFYPFNITYTFSGLFTNNSSASAYEIKILRPNGDVIRDKIVERVSGLPQQFNFVEFGEQSTFVFDSGADPYQTDGFKLAISKTLGSDLTLQAQQDLGAGLEDVIQEVRFWR